jgi:hypothetical protein
MILAHSGLATVLAMAALQPSGEPSTGAHASLYREVLAAHRNGPCAQRVTIHARDEQGSAQSVVIVRTDRGDSTRARRLRLDLGELIVCAENSRLVAVHAANPDTFFEHRFDSPISPQLIRTVLPPLPLPQIGWALGDDDAPASWIFWGLGKIEDPSVQGTVQGVRVASEDTRAPVRVADFARTPAGLLLSTLNADSLDDDAAFTHDPPRLTLLCEGLEAMDPATWMIDTSARTSVPSITQLRPKPSEVSVGDHLPALGLVTRDLEGWSITRELEAERARPPRGGAPVFAALLLLHRDGNGTGVRAVALELDALARDFAHMRTRADASSPRLIARSVVLVEPENMSAARAAELLDGVPALPALGEALLSTSGVATVERLCPGCAAAVVVVNEQLRVVGVARVEPDLVDARGVAEVVRRLVSTRDSETAPAGGPEDGTGSAAGPGPR